MIIDRSECQVGLPSLKLEGYSPSPLLHMKLQSELITHLSRRFGLPKNVVSPADVREYQGIVAAWMSNFPPSYALDEPDRSADLQRPWIALHRHCLHTMSYTVLLDPMRAYLARPMTASSPPHDLAIRSDGIDCCLRLMDALHRFFNHVYPKDAKYHLVLFCIFDTAAVLCSVLMHDEDCSIPRRGDMLAAVDEAVAILKRLNTTTKTAKTSYDILLRVSQRVMRPAKTATHCFSAGNNPRAVVSRVGGMVTTPPSAHQVGDVGSAESYAYSDIMPKSGILASHTPSPHSMSSADGVCPSGPFMCRAASSHGGTSVDGCAGQSTSPVDYMSAGEYAHSAQSLNMTPPMEDMYQPVEFGNITQQELGDLASMWNYESLNLHFIDPQQ